MPALEFLRNWTVLVWGHLIAFQVFQFSFAKGLIFSDLVECQKSKDQWVSGKVGKTKARVQQSKLPALASQQITGRFTYLAEAAQGSVCCSSFYLFPEVRNQCGIWSHVVVQPHFVLSFRSRVILTCLVCLDKVLEPLSSTEGLEGLWLLCAYHSHLTSL